MAAPCCRGCGACGSGISMRDREKNGRIRVRCSTVRERGTCDNTVRIRLERLDTTVLGGMRDHLADQAPIKAYVNACNDER